MVERYTALTGRQGLPPLWALGYHQSRWSYYPEARVRRLVADFRDTCDVPCDAIHLDIHALDGYRCFTWDEDRFPDPAGMIAELHRRGFKVVVIVDAGIKVDPPTRSTEAGWRKVAGRLALDHPRLTDLLRWLIPAGDEALDYRGWPISAISEDSRPGARLRALETGPYGRCVYRCDNDVVDHQTVNMVFENGTSAVLVMHGHAHEEARTMRYDGTRATLRGRFAYGIDDAIEIHDHRTGQVERIDLSSPTGGVTGHGGGDDGVVAAFVRAVRRGRQDGGGPPSRLPASLWRASCWPSLRTGPGWRGGSSTWPPSDGRQKRLKRSNFP